MPSRTEGGLRPAHQPPTTETRPILNILVKMKTNNKADSSIKFVDKALTYLSEHADLNNPEPVKFYIARLKKKDGTDAGNGYKHNLQLAYDKYCEYYGIEWTPTEYKRQSRAFRIPTTKQLEMLIAHARTTMSTKLRLSKETGLRPVELCNLRVKDVDMETRTIYPSTAKYGAPRKLKISTSLKTALQRHIDKKNLKPKDKLFKGDSAYYSKLYRQLRNTLAEKLCKPELKSIRLYDFRHYFATMLYHKTRDILLVKQQMGHRKLETTLIYTQLLSLNDDEWTCKTASNVKESKQLIEAGFEYVTEQNGLKLFRKRK